MLYDLNVLGGAVLLALVAANAFPHLGMGLSQVIVIDHLGGHVVLLEQGEILQDGNVPEALHRAVNTARAGDVELALNELCRLVAESHLFLIHRTEIFMV